MLGAAAMAGFSVCHSLPQWLLFLAGAAGIQLRLLCNLMDGMVAVEGNRKSPTGELWNEIPDRLADGLLLVGAGFAAGSPMLGAVAVLGALLTAYLRAFSASLTRRQDFCGPMAKPHRMATLTVACLLAAVAPSWAPPSLILTIALWIIIGGVAITSVRRISHLAHSLRSA
jgi:phosphatidylglycerophosphate synthase